MPSTTLRQSILAGARRLVVKFGTQLLTGDDGHLDVAYIHEMASQIAALRKDGYEITVVSSGAIGAGLAELKMDKRPRDVAELQAVAAVGQRRLMTYLHDAFLPHSLGVGQVLVTRGDFDDRQRYLNIRNCITHLHRLGCVPILNENDTVAVEELRFGDNDQLAALTCNALRADALILLTVVNGLLDEKGQRIDLVDELAAVQGHVRAEKSRLGSGGMQSKLTSVGLATEAGEIAVIANGREPNVLRRLLAGEADLGTVFAPAKKKLDARQRWIGLTKRPAGMLTIDDGALAALKRGKSLLPAGIKKVEGTFDRGDVIAVLDKEGHEVARGLSNYSADETRLIQGLKSSQLGKTLGREAYDEVIHRDHLVMTGKT
ncbi:MAG: glutamate 5-kinase [Phycisphaeraceae bacterium]